MQAGLRIGVVVGLLVALAGCNRPASAPVELPARSVPVSTEAAEQLADRVAQVFSRQGPVTLTLTEEELTSYLAVYGTGDILQSPAIWLSEGAIRASARLCAGRGYQLHAILTLQSHHGVQVRIQQVTLNDKHLPRLLLLGIEDAANDALADLGSPLALSDISITEGLIVVRGEIN